MVAGICVGMMKGLSGADILRSAAAAAHGSILLEGTQLCSAEDYNRFMECIQVEKV